LTLPTADNKSKFGAGGRWADYGTKFATARLGQSFAVVRDLAVVEARDGELRPLMVWASCSLGYFRPGAGVVPTQTGSPAPTETRIVR
jgi:hypothetical protein